MSLVPHPSLPVLGAGGVSQLQVLGVLGVSQLLLLGRRPHRNLGSEGRLRSCSGRLALRGCLPLLVIAAAVATRPVTKKMRKEPLGLPTPHWRFLP